MAKRLADLCIATTMLIILLPILILIGIIVRVTSKGPIIFKQKRLGYQCTAFTILKFRTMVDGSGKTIDDVEKGDPRVTKVGRFLRSTHLDELPQLWNVVNGEMSLVGPRPDPYEKALSIMQENPIYAEIFKVRPGMTGPAQICGRMWQNSHKEKVLEKNIEYTKCKSVFGDLWILLLTILVILRRQGV